MKGHIQYNIQYNCIGHIYIFCLYLYLYLYLHLYRLELRAVEQLDIWIGTHGNSPSPLQYIQNSEYIVQLWYWSFNSLEFHCPWSRLFHRNVLTPFGIFLPSHIILSFSFSMSLFIKLIIITIIIISIVIIKFKWTGSWIKSN